MKPSKVPGEHPKEDAPEEYGRRQFLMLLSGGIAALIGGVLGSAGLAFFLTPAWKKKKEDWQEVVAASELPEGKPVKMDYVQRQADGWVVNEGRNSVWLLKESGSVIAYSPKCTHLGCPFTWDDAKNSFVCPCHSGVFNKAGAVISGPPPRGLDRYGVKLERGIVYVLPGGGAQA